MNRGGDCRAAPGRAGSANNVGPLCNHLYKPNRPYLLVSNFKLSLEGSSKPKKIMLYKKGLIHHF